MKLSDKDKRSKLVVVDSSIRTSYQFLLECTSFKRKNYFYLCYQFFKQIREKYGGKKPIYTDGAQWYIDACKWLRLKHTLFIEQNLRILWKDSSSRSKTEQNASMII